MKVWMVIGYGDCECSSVDNVFVKKSDAVNSLIQSTFSAWAIKDYDLWTRRYVGEPHIKMEDHNIGYEEFVNKVRDYINNNDLDSVYMWAGSKILTEIFPYWTDRSFYTDSWFSIKEVNLQE